MRIENLDHARSALAEVVRSARRLDALLARSSSAVGIIPDLTAAQRGAAIAKFHELDAALAAAVARYAAVKNAESALPQQ